MLPDVTFECHLTRDDSALTLVYTVGNGTSGELGIFNRIKSIRIDGGVDFSPDSIFVDLEGGVLHLRKMALPLPPGLQVTAYIPPRASRVPAGASFTEAVTLPLPARVCHPFKRVLVPGEVVADVPASAASVEVSIGVFPCDGGCRLISEHPAFPHVLSPHPPGVAVARQQVLSARFPLDAPLPVLDYRGVPW